ncbi:DUF2868 domain-containing protein [Marinomonas algarum]|uniref:DUF2868 domain-containing protein n=1 Tax=Marinomonas algarum TaxID=2883105 RepID=A0A9X1INL2_9GAMM|nr:DUF2868 domain-containing protein [Marinomonas algarum]MCB5162558.1 DUF2868 domain-containing protein [Marinomonas algarum]
MTSLMPRAKLALAAWLETHTDFRLPTDAKDLPSALNALNNYPAAISYSEQFWRLKRYFIRTLMAVFVVSFILGFLAVPSAFATHQSSQINIFWLLLVLLGFHGLNLLIWSITVLSSRKKTMGHKGALLSVLLFLNRKIGQFTQVDPHVSQAFLHWQCPPRANVWLVSGVSHGAWASYLFAGWLMTLLLLLTNQVDFVWETTLLSDQAFLSLTQSLSSIPQWFGLALPNHLDILASRVDLVSQTASTRQHWANFLLASIMLYGVLPRLLLAGLCWGLYQWQRARLPLSSTEEIIQNRYQHKETQIKHIVDAPMSSPSNSATTVTDDQGALSPAALSGHWALFEWSDATPELLAQAASITLLNSRDQQAQFLTSADAAPVYVVVNGAQSPDRGTRRFFTEASKSYPSLTLVIAGEKTAPFTDDWRHLAADLQLSSTPLAHWE